MATDKCGFDSKRLCVTFDGDIVDMLRSIYIMKEYENGIMENVVEQGKFLRDKLQTIPQLNNTRGVGLMTAFDMDDEEARDAFVEKVRENGMILNPTGENSIRLRPNLAVDRIDIEKCIEIIKKCV